MKPLMPVFHVRRRRTLLVPPCEAEVRPHRSAAFRLQKCAIGLRRRLVFAPPMSSRAFLQPKGCAPMASDIRCQFPHVTSWML